MNLGRIAGIRLSIHWTFVILLVWIFFMYYRMGQGVMPALMGVVFILALFVCVILHELGHALTARRFNITTRSITLLPIGGLAHMEKLPEKPAQELWVALAGPAVNVVLAILLYVWLVASDSMPSLLDVENVQLRGGWFWLNLLLANVVLAVFNLIPAFPMDGGRVLRALLAFRYDRGKATRIAASVGQLLAIFFVFFGFFSNIWLVFIGVFIYLGAGAEAALETTKSALAGHTVNDVLMKQFSRLSPGDKLEKAVQLLLNGQEQEFVVAEDGQVAGILTRKELVKGLSEHGQESPVSNVMRKDCLILSPGMPLSEVYQKLMSSRCSVAPVMEGGQLLGIVDKENIEELIMIEEALKKENGGV